MLRAEDLGDRENNSFYLCGKKRPLIFISVPAYDLCSRWFTLTASAGYVSMLTIASCDACNGKVSLLVTLCITVDPNAPLYIMQPRRISSCHGGGTENTGDAQITAAARIMHIWLPWLLFFSLSSLLHALLQLQHERMILDV